MTHLRAERIWSRLGEPKGRSDEIWLTAELAGKLLPFIQQIIAYERCGGRLIDLGKTAEEIATAVAVSKMNGVVMRERLEVMEVVI